MKKDSSPILEVNHLSVKFAMSGGDVLAVRDVSFKLHRGRTMGFVGESGCGKSVTAYSILRLVPPPGVIHSGNIMYDGRVLISGSAQELADDPEARKIYLGERFRL